MDYCNRNSHPASRNLEAGILNYKALIFAAVVVAVVGIGIFFITEEEDSSSIILSDGMIERTYEWSYSGQRYSLTLVIPSEDYQAAKSISRGTVTLDSYASYIDEDAACVTALAKALKVSAGSQDVATLALSFVQSLQYKTDIEGTGYREYPKYPVETLADAEGDCEDVSGLYVSILRALGYDAVMIFVPTGPSTGHMAAGVAGNYSGGEIMDIDTKIYHYAECTSKGWRIGEVPSTIPFGTDGTKIIGGST